MFEERIAAMNQRTEEAMALLTQFSLIREPIRLMRFRIFWASAEPAHTTL